MRRSDRPELVVLAGPNGAGKSSLHKAGQFEGRFINADEIARGLDPIDPERQSMAAGRETVRRLDEAFLANADIVYETTLSSHQSLNVIRRAKTIGYGILLVFVALDSPDLHVLRVAQRVAAGGHDIPAATIRRRYDICFENLAKALPLCDIAVLFDNSLQEPVKKLELEDGWLCQTALDEMRTLDRRFASAVEKAHPALRASLFGRR